LHFPRLVTHVAGLRDIFLGELVVCFLGRFLPGIPKLSHHNRASQATNRSGSQTFRNATSSKHRNLSYSLRLFRC
jgi:hypothetical protein